MSLPQPDIAQCASKELVTSKELGQHITILNRDMLAHCWHSYINRWCVVSSVYSAHRSCGVMSIFVFMVIGAALIYTASEQMMHRVQEGVAAGVQDTA